MDKKKETKKSNEWLLNWRYELVAKHIAEGSRVLDIGAGTGWVAQRLQERKACEVQLVDVVDRNETTLPLQLYDGRKLPYASNAFDVAVLVFVLHHTLNHTELLEETARVARQRIVIVEDTPKNRLERATQWMCDTMLNLEHGFATPHSYKSIAGWHSLFTTIKLPLVSTEVVKPFFPFYYTKAVFVVDCNALTNRTMRR